MGDDFARAMLKLRHEDAGNRIAIALRLLKPLLSNPALSQHHKQTLAVAVAGVQRVAAALDGEPRVPTGETSPLDGKPFVFEDEPSVLRLHKDGTTCLAATALECGRAHVFHREVVDV